MKEKEIKHIWWSLCFKKIIVVILCIFLLIISIIYNHRIYLFSRIFSVMFFNIKNSGLILYFLCLFILTIFTLIQLFSFYVDFKTNYYDKSIKLDKKLDLPSFILKCVVGFLSIMIFITSPCTVVGSSMENTFTDGDRVLCLNVFSDVKKGDVVVLDAIKYDNDDSFYIKRVVANANSTIRWEQVDLNLNDSCRGFLYIDGEKLKKINNQEQYITYMEYKTIINKYNNVELTYTLSFDELILLGDNRDNSRDSRYFGKVKIEDIYGIVYFRFFPFSKISTF